MERCTVYKRELSNIDQWRHLILKSRLGKGAKSLEKVRDLSVGSERSL